MTSDAEPRCDGHGCRPLDNEASARGSFRVVRRRATPLHTATADAVCRSSPTNVTGGRSASPRWSTACGQSAAAPPTPAARRPGPQRPRSHIAGSSTNITVAKFRTSTVVTTPKSTTRAVLIRENPMPPAPTISAGPRSGCSCPAGRTRARPAPCRARDRRDDDRGAEQRVRDAASTNRPRRRHTSLGPRRRGATARLDGCRCRCRRGRVRRRIGPLTPRRGRSPPHRAARRGSSPRRAPPRCTAPARPVKPVPVVPRAVHLSFGSTDSCSLGHPIDRSPDRLIGLRALSSESAHRLRRTTPTPPAATRSPPAENGVPRVTWARPEVRGASRPRAATAPPRRPSVTLPRRRGSRRP
ncbi:hypothetical protein AHOG_16200 [Actinoalloteichus hoggarensis]|uniref:Uncharacterized protein n=1 Tax=Actinoalloteichus hoggarensis TaxID=1470176 RepID=A0A221W5C8_9PSEU|nr:hypothetical protein AHOG_16200 [Actinoalloteichus hoggarensis]